MLKRLYVLTNLEQFGLEPGDILTYNETTGKFEMKKVASKTLDNGAKYSEVVETSLDYSIAVDLISEDKAMLAEANTNPLTENYAKAEKLAGVEKISEQLKSIERRLDNVERKISPFRYLSF